MSLSDRKPMRACGKRYASVDEAQRSKAVTVNGHEVVTGCPCGGVHTSPKREKPKAVLSLRPQGRDDGPTPKVRKLVLERDDYRCVCCGKSILGQRYSLGHRVRASQGGKAVPENLVTLLGWGGESHHGRIDGYKDPADGQGAKGYRLPSGADPAMEPVLIVSEHGADFVWLTPGGKYDTEPPERRAA